MISKANTPAGAGEQSTRLLVVAKLHNDIKPLDDCNQAQKSTCTNSSWQALKGFPKMEVAYLHKDYPYLTAGICIKLAFTELWDSVTLELRFTALELQGPHCIWTNPMGQNLTGYNPTK